MLRCHALIFEGYVLEPANNGEVKWFSGMAVSYQTLWSLEESKSEHVIQQHNYHEVHPPSDSSFA